MRGWRGVFAGALALIALQTVVGSDAAANRTGGALAGIASLARRALSPGIALVPDIRPPNGNTFTVIKPSAATTPDPTTRPTTPAAPSHGTTILV